MKNTILGVVIFFIHITSIFSQEQLYSHHTPLPCVNRTFYAYVHVVHDSLGNPLVNEQQLRALFASANAAFTPICIQFDYCKLDIINDYSFESIDDADEITLVTSRFQQERRINIYITNSVLSPNENSFSIHNGITKPDGGIIIIPSSGKGFIHELGHLFGLYHTFEDRFGVEKVERTDCENTGDQLCDTPADPYVLGENYTEYLRNRCEFYSKKKDADGQFYEAESGNYMSHYFCGHCFFTNEQYKKMVNNYLTSTFKMW